MGMHRAGEAPMTPSLRRASLLAVLSAQVLVFSVSPSHAFLDFVGEFVDWALSVPGWIKDKVDPPDQLGSASAICVQYARSAVIQAAEAKGLGCTKTGFYSGGKWRDNQRGHQSSCGLQTDEDGGNGETAAREAGLATCRHGPGYANGAANAAKRAHAAGCTFLKGGRWDEDAGNHLRFCIAESNANAADKGESFFGLFGLMLIPRFAAFLPPQILDEEDQARRDERKQC